MDQKTTGELMHARGVTASKLISAAQIQRNYGYQILDGRRVPPVIKSFLSALH